MRRDMTLIGYAVIIIFSLLIGASLGLTNSSNAEETRSIIEGTTTKEEIENYFGEPTFTIVSGEKMEIWIYENLSSKGNSIIFVFDENKILVSYGALSKKDVVREMKKIWGIE